MVAAEALNHSVSTSLYWRNAHSAPRVMKGSWAHRMGLEPMLRFQKASKHGDPWTPEDDAQIRNLANNHSLAFLARLLGRSVGSIEGRATFLGVKVSHRVPKIRD